MLGDLVAIRLSGHLSYDGGKGVNQRHEHLISREISRQAYKDRPGVMYYLNSAIKPPNRDIWNHLSVFVVGDRHINVVAQCGA